jgi:peptide/nickel transport system substrate-binding protein
VELDLEKRQQLFIQMNDMLIEDVAMIPVVHLAVVQGIKRNIEGVDLTPWDASTWNIQDWRRVSP